MWPWEQALTVVLDSLLVRVYDNAGVPAAERKRAFSRAADILERVELSAAWLECPPPAVNCAVLSSPGAFGFTPWLDRDLSNGCAICPMKKSSARWSATSSMSACPRL